MSQPNPEHVDLFNKLVDEAKQYYEALQLLSQIIKITTAEDAGNPNTETMDRLIDEIVAYGDRRIMDDRIR